MYKSKLLLLIKSFSQDEIKKFSDFISSPYFNRNRTLIRFYSEIKHYYPEFTKEKVEKEKFYSKLFPGKKFNEQVMKNLISDLIKLCKEFLQTELSRNDNYERRMNLLRQLVERKADPVFYSEIKSFELELNDISEFSEKSFYYLFQLEELKISFHLLRNEQPLVFEKVINSGEYLILFFHLHLTKTISNLNVNKQSFNVEYKTNLPEEFFKNTGFNKIIEYMKRKKIKYSEILELYYYRVLCNTHPFDESYYYKFKDLLLKNMNSLGKVEIYGLFNALETFCMRKINSGSAEFVEELFEIFNTEIEKGFYKYSDTSPVTFMKFRNTYLPALKLKKFDWAKKFIEDFKNDIIDSDRDNVVKIANAQIDFEKGDFGKVLESIATLNPDLLYLKIDIRILTLMSYYEMNYTESVLSLIDSFRHFIASNKSLSNEFKENNLRFINALNSFILFKEKNHTGNMQELLDKLKPFLIDRRISWLSEKIKSEIKKNI